MEFEGHFEQNIKQLIQIIKKFLSSYPHSHGPKYQELESFLKKDQAVNFNLIFFNVFPPEADDFFDDLPDVDEDPLAEFEEDSADVRHKLSFADLEFLRKNGIRF